jgi:hypothetical protein
MVTMQSCLRAIAERREQSQLDPLLDILSTTDGLVAAIAMITEGSGMFQSQRERREFADNMRSGLLKHMKDARANIDAHRGVAN